MKKLKKIHTVISDFLIYFSLCAFVVTCSFLLFFQGIEVQKEQVYYAAIYTFFNVVFISLVFMVLDTIRRKITVDKPVKEIKNVLKRIENGDFSAKLVKTGSIYNFDEIMDSINRMTQELNGVETLRTDFIANVSHEMKTPLAVIQNYGQLLQTPNLSEEKRLEYAGIITNSSKKLADLMTNILKLNRLENQQIYPKKEKYDLGEQLCECLLQYESIWEKSDIEIETDIQEEVTIETDGELISLVWNNLLSNAFKFTEAGGRVTVVLTADDTFATVKIADTGCGMSADVGAHIFEKFYQGDTSHSTAGNGLGLALVKRIMDITGGEISVESVVGKGSVFTVKLKRG